MPFDSLLSAIHQLMDAVLRLQGMLDPSAIVAKAVASSAQDVMGIFDAYVLTTRDALDPHTQFIQQRAIAEHAPVVRLVANAGLAAVAMWAAYRLMWTHSVRSLYTVRILLPRLLLAVVLVNWCLPLFQDAIEVNNALCRMVGRVQVLDLRTLNGINDLGSGPALTVLSTAGLLLGYILLAFAYIVRYALLVVLAVTAPAAALLFVLPETHHLARQWGSLFVAALFMQPLQLMILAIGFSLNLDGLSPLRHLFALAALYIAFKVPGALHSSSAAGTRAFSAAGRHAGRAVHLAARA